MAKIKEISRLRGVGCSTSTDLSRKWEREDDCEPGHTDVMILKAEKKEERE